MKADKDAWLKHLEWAVEALLEERAAAVAMLRAKAESARNAGGDVIGPVWQASLLDAAEGIDRGLLRPIE